MRSAISAFVLVVVSCCASSVPRDQATVERELEAYAGTKVVVHGVAATESDCAHDAPPATGLVACDEGAALVTMTIDWSPVDERLSLDAPLLGQFFAGAADAHHLPGYHLLAHYAGVLYDEAGEYTVECGGTPVDSSWSRYLGNYLPDIDVERNHLDHAGLRAAIQRGADSGLPLKESEFVPGCREDALPPG